MSGYRPSYSLDEDIKILQSIIDSQLYYVLRGDAFWKDLSAVGHLDRTWMSLQNRFFKYILPNISKTQYKISELEKRKIELACWQTSVKFKQDLKNLEENNTSANDDNDSEVDNPNSSSEDENENGELANDPNNKEPTSDNSIVFNVNSPVTKTNTNCDGEQTKCKSNSSKDSHNDSSITEPENLSAIIDNSEIFVCTPSEEET